MTKKIIEKIKEKEKERELKSKKGQKSMQRNKTVSNFRNTRRDRNNNIATNNNSRTLKANKSMGHFLRKEKNDKEKKDIYLENKKKGDLKYLSMTPKRSEKAKSFYSKTDVNRSDINKNERFNRKKSEKKLITNLKIKGKEDKVKDKKEKIIKKKEENITIKKIDIEKSNKRPSKQIIKEKEKEKKDIKNIEKEKIKDNKNKEKNKSKIDDKKEKKENKKRDDKKEGKKGIKNQKNKDNKEGEKKEIKKEPKNVEVKKKEDKKENELKENNKKGEEKEEEKKDVVTKKEEEIKQENKESIKSENKNDQNKIKENDKVEEFNPKKEDKIKLSKIIFHRLINYYDKIHKFLNNEEIKNLLLLSKDSALSILPIIKEINSKQIQENEKAIKEFKSKYKEEEYLKSIKSLEISKASIKVLEKLNEEKSANIFTSEKIPNKDLIYIYRLFLQLINKDKEINNKNDKEFWNLAKDKIFTNKKGELSENVKEMLTQLNFSEENLRLVNNIYKECMDKFSIPKYYNNLCPTTGIFFFLVKEILEYCGILVGKKTSIPLIYKRLDYELKLTKKNEEKLNRMNEMAHKKKSLFKKSD